MRTQGTNETSRGRAGSSKAAGSCDAVGSEASHAWTLHEAHGLAWRGRGVSEESYLLYQGTQQVDVDVEAGAAPICCCCLALHMHRYDWPRSPEVSGAEQRVMATIKSSHVCCNKENTRFRAIWLPRAPSSAFSREHGV